MAHCLASANGWNIPSWQCKIFSAICGTTLKKIFVTENIFLNTIVFVSEQALVQMCPDVFA